MSSLPPVPDPAAAQAGPWLAHLGEAVEEILWAWDPGSGLVLYANAGFERFWGMAAGDLGRGHEALLDRIHPDDRERIRKARRQLPDVPYTEEYRVVLPAMGDKPARIARLRERAFAGPGPGGNPCITHVARDLSEQDVRSALVRERELAELKSRFIAVASHEFRTPLAAILSSIELLDDYGPRLPDIERKEIVGLVKDAVSRMNTMVEQILLTSRLEAGKFAFEPEARNIPDLLIQVAHELGQAHHPASRIAMRCEDVQQVRMVDGKLLSHILVNLLGNALKYSPPDSVVTCTAMGEGQNLLLSVADRGIGIPAADLPRLFESFHRGTNVGNIPGTGIGLHIVKECVELHRGSIEVHSEPGQGATFHVRLHAPPAS